MNDAWTPDALPLSSDPVADAIRRERESLAAEIERIEAALTPLRLRLRSLDTALAALTGKPQAAAVPGTKTEKIIEIVQRHARPMRAAEVRDIFVREGGVETRSNDVMAVLTRVVGRHVRRISKGVYEAMP